MSNLFETLFGKLTKPVRRDTELRWTVDADGHPTVETVSGESFSLSPEGSIDRVKLTADRFYHCGCNAELPLGGRCGETGCGRISCAQHAGNCNRCSVPVCLEHSRYAATPEGGDIRLCRSCFERKRRTRVAKSVALVLLRPFVDFEKGGRHE